MPSLIERYDRLGPKTYFMLLISRMGIFLSSILLFITFLFIRPYMPVLEQYDLNLIGSILFLIAIVIYIASWGIAGLEYSNYSIFLERDDLKVRRGIFEIKEEMVPYRY